MQWFRRLIGTTDAVEPGGATDTAPQADSQSANPAEAGKATGQKTGQAGQKAGKAGASGRPSGDPRTAQSAEQAAPPAAALKQRRDEPPRASDNRPGQGGGVERESRDNQERRNRKTRKNTRSGKQRARESAPSSSSSAGMSKSGASSASAPPAVAAKAPAQSAPPKPMERKSYFPPPSEGSSPSAHNTHQAKSAHNTHQAKTDLKTGVRTVHAIAVSGSGQPRVAPPPRSKPKGDAGPDLDAIFDQLEAGGLPLGLTEADVQAAVEEARANAVLFQQMAYEHARPLREFMLELAMGATARQWLDVVLPLVENLYKSAAALGQEGLAKALVSYHRSLISASKQPASKVAGLARERLLSGYQAVIAAMPEAFDFGEERKLREPLLVQHLLRQVPGVHKNTIDKLYGAGLGSLDALCRSTTADLVAMGQVDEARAQAIVRHFRSYRDERLTSPRDPESSQEQCAQRLGELSEQLAEAQEAFAKAEEADDRRRKREARSRRQAITLEMIVLLIQLGEVDLAEAIERSATQRKLEQVRSFVEQNEQDEQDADPHAPARFS